MTDYNPTDVAIEACANSLVHHDTVYETTDKKTELAKITPVLVLAVLKCENGEAVSLSSLSYEIQHYAQIGWKHEVASENKIRRVLSACPKAALRGHQRRKRWVYMGDAAREAKAAERLARHEREDAAQELADRVAPELEASTGSERTDVNTTALVALLEEVEALRANA